MADEARFLDLAGAAARLCVSKSYLSKLVMRRRIPYIKLGRLLRFDVAQLDRWALRRQVLPRDWEGGKT